LSIFASSISSFWQQMEDCGIDPAPLFRKHGIESTAVFDPGSRISYLKLDRVMGEAVELSGDPFFSLKEAKYLLPSHLGPLGFAWLASTSLRSAFQRVQRYIKVLHENLQVTLHDSEDALVVSFNLDAPSVNLYQRDIGYLAIITRMCRFNYGDQWHPLRVTVAHPTPPDQSYFYTLFRCPVDFEAEENCLHIDLKQADKRLTGASKQLAQLNDHIVVRYLAHLSRNDVVNRVKATILDGLGEGAATESSVAQTMNTSIRNLNRKLSNEDTSFKALLMEIRRELAEQYINDSTLTLTEISFLLGFSEVSSFSRAYRRWEGQSPSEARKSRQ
jgi:AraC-like DNA-binding protein